MKTALLVLRRAFSLLTTEPAVVLRILVPAFVALYIMGFAQQGTAMMVLAPSATVMIAFVIGICLVLVVLPSAAVAFHRYALTGEHPSGVIPGLSTGRWLPYLGWGILVGLFSAMAIAATATATGLFLNLIVDATSTTSLLSMNAFVIIALVSSFVGNWLTLRVFLILPSAALGPSDFSLARSYRETRNVSSAIWVLTVFLFVLEILPIVPTYLLMESNVTDWLRSPFVLALFNAANWIILLAIATTLYGHLVENRQLEDA